MTSQVCNSKYMEKVFKSETFQPKGKTQHLEKTHGGGSIILRDALFYYFSVGTGKLFRIHYKTAKDR